MRKCYSFGLISFLVSIYMLAPAPPKRSTKRQSSSPPAEPQRTNNAATGQSKTLLPDGRWLILGGENGGAVVGTASMLDTSTGLLTRLSNGMVTPRAWHTATLLPNGTVFIFGGVGADGQVVTTAEIFDPVTQQFQTLAASTLTPRAHHSCTLLTDGTVLIVGGISRSNETLSSADSWNWQTSNATALSKGMVTARSGQTATLMADGEVVLWGGLDRNGAAINYGEIYDPTASTFRIETTPYQTPSGSLQLEQSIPADGTDDVDASVIVALRFSEPLSVTSANPATVTLTGPSGQVPILVVPAETGILTFVTPQSPLAPATSYTLTLSGLADPAGNALPQTTVNFTILGTALSDNGLSSGSGESGTETQGNQSQNLPTLKAKAGVTALAGQSLRLNGSPLEGLTIQDETSGEKTRTDRTGRFLLQPLTAGHHVLFVDGRTARNGAQVYGTYEIGVDILNGQTNVLTYTIWMTALDTAHTVKIPSPTTADMVITNPSLPGLELHIPAGTVITDHDGKVVREINMTAVPVSQPPFPIPGGTKVPIYFTIQPGAAYLTVNGGWGTQGAQLYYPNSAKALPGTLFNFWNYDPDSKGWYVYGQGKVSADATEVVPDPGVRIYEFTGAMIFGGGGCPACPPPGGGGGGDPVDFATGLFIYKKTDLIEPDTLPIVLTRTYRPMDSVSRAFGIGATHPYDMYLAGDSADDFAYAELVLPDGAHLRYTRITPGNDYASAVFVHSSTPTIFYGSKIVWNGNGWTLTLKDGTKYMFPEASTATRAQQGALLSITDRNGNILNITRDSNKNLTQITTPNGRWVKFTYDSSYRVTQATDNIGRTVSYMYDSGGRLSTVTDVMGGKTSFTYDTNNNMLTVTDPRGVTYITNEYDSSNRVIKQTMADGSTYQFAYTPSSFSSQNFFIAYGPNYTGPGPGIDNLGFRACQGCEEGFTSTISQVDLTDPRGFVRKVILSSTGYPLTDTRALGAGEQQTTAHDYFPDNLTQSSTDPLDRTTSFVYDANANLTQATWLSGTAGALSVNFAYESAHSQVISASDPLGHTTNFNHDSNGNVVAVTDPLGHQESVTYNSAGQPLSVTDPLGNITTFAYDLGDLLSITDPLGRTTTRFLDEAGRLVSVTNPLGQRAQLAYNAFDQITKITDAAGNATTLTYDPNSDLLSLTDANGHITSYTYDAMGRPVTRTDPLSNTETYMYDPTGNLIQFTDRRGKVATLQYDPLNRRTLAGFGASIGTPNTYESTITYSYDAGNRPTSIVDSAAGTITPKFDNFNHLISEQTPQGMVSYSYDLAGRRTQMTVAGQTGINYTYDNANRLTQIVQGSSTVSFAYDGSNRRTALTLPNGIVMSYGYDNASQLTGITYTNAGSTLGTLTYAYDSVGHRTQIGGSMAQTALPLAVGNISYNADNQLTQWGDASLYYDQNGNTTSDDLNSYTWNSRNQLVSMNFGASNFQYDAFGRRISKTVSGTTTNYLYDGANVVQELSGSTPMANLLSGGIDEVFTRTDSSGTANFLRDALGSTLALTSSSATSLAQYTYEPFGNTFVTSGSSTNSYEYTGRENDGTGIYFYRGRYYNPTFQRFMSEDPIGFAGGDSNLYAYVRNNPLNLRDSLGLSPFDSCRGGNAGSGSSSESPWWNPCTKFILTVAIGVGVDVLTEGAATPELLELAEEAEEAENITPVIGRLPDTQKFANIPGYEIVDSAGWTSETNAAWIQSHIDAGSTFQLASSITESNILSTTNASGFTIFADEISQILNAGYTWEGDFLLPPE
jgi:RHS repeat-associated protein